MPWASLARSWTQCTPALTSRTEPRPGPKGMPTSTADLEADLGTTHDELEPLDGQLEDEPISIARVGTLIH